MIPRISGAAAILAAFLLALPACKQRTTRTVQPIEEKPRLSSTIHMGDPAFAGQLVNGFYGIEAKAWRWTGRQFSVELRRPASAVQKGGSLELHLTVPGSNFERLGSQSLSASIGGVEIPPETFSNPGDYVYRRYVPANLLMRDTVRIDFQLDKAVPPGAVDQRELGIVVQSISLESR